MDDESDDVAVLLEGAGKSYGDQWAVRDLTLSVPHGTVLGLIGPSGCGKTTTIRLVTGAARADEGTVEVLGRAPTDLTLSERQRLGYLPQLPVLFEDLSLWENLQFHSALNGVLPPRSRRLRELLELTDLLGDERKLVREASGGMRRRVALAATLVHRPRLLLLDEPTAGIDPVLRRRFWDRFRELRDAGTTLVVTTQYVGEAADCDLVAMMSGGRILTVGTPDELRYGASGGEIVEVRVERGIADDTFARLTAIEGVLDGGERVGADHVRLLVDDGGVVLPAALELLRDEGHEIVDSEEVELDWDDVFVRLLEQDEAESDHSRQEAGEGGGAGADA